MDTSRDYTTTDVNWYLGVKEQASQDYREMFVHVHAKVGTLDSKAHGS